jgi:uncharacterized protein (DUF427 family)
MSQRPERMVRAFCVMLGAGDRDYGGGVMSIQFRGMLASGVGQLRYEPTAKRIRAVLGGHTVVDTTRAILLWEPRRIPSDKRTYCAYKGQASYWSMPAGGGLGTDIAWTYQDPLHDALNVCGLIAFFNERVDLVVDGERRERPITPWSPRPGS